MHARSVRWHGVGGGGNATLDDEASEEDFGLWLDHVGSLPELEEAHGGLYPLDVGVFGAYRIALGTRRVARLVEDILGGRVGGHVTDWPHALPGSGDGIY